MVKNILQLLSTLYICKSTEDSCWEEERKKKVEENANEKIYSSFKLRKYKILSDN